jgi:hypothetical protein
MSFDVKVCAFCGRGSVPAAAGELGRFLDASAENAE